MTSHPDFDIIVVGAGAAGIAAARQARLQGRSVLLLEARDRPGGRARTVHAPGGAVIDLGAAWLHSAPDNPMTVLAREAGMPISTRGQDDWDLRLRHNGLSAAELADFDREFAAYNSRVAEASQRLEDRAIATCQIPGSRWNPLFSAMISWGTGTMPEQVSLRARQFRSYTGINWRIAEGYGTLMERLAADLPIRFNTAVEEIDWSGPAVTVRAGGATLRAGAVVITVPASVLAAEAIRFTPALPQAKLAALGGLPSGVNNKLYLDLPGGLAGLPQDTHLVGSVTTAATGSYQVQPMGRPLLEMFLGADLAIQLERDGPEAMADFARQELVGLFGAAAVPSLRPVAWSGWGQDPFSRGGYSFARPGHAEDRRALSEPLADRLFFAGEACSMHWHSTVHGAWVTGQDAALAASACTAAA